MEKNLLEIKNLVVQYVVDRETVEAVNGIDLEIGYGETLGLVGETGAGKTTTALSVMGLIPNPPGRMVSGEIIYDGRTISGLKEKEYRKIRGGEITMIFQDPMTSLNPVMTVGEQIAEVVRLHAKCSRLEAVERAVRMLELVGITSERYHQYPHEFSGGMKQRVMIAIALACTPKLLIADEPTTALDVTIQAQVLELMNELKEKLRTSLLLITHDLGVVAQVCDRVAIMYAGEIVESGTIAEVFDHPHHPYTIGLFGSIPSLDETAEKLKPIQGQMPDPTELPEGCAFAPRCPYATGACRTRKPEMTGVGGTQMVRCLAHQGVFESPELMEEVRHGR